MTKNSFMWTIYDRIAGLYTAPTISENRLSALREFKKLMTETKYPVGDFDFVEVGRFDPTSCNIILTIENKEIINGVAALADNEKELIEEVQI